MLKEEDKTARIPRRSGGNQKVMMVKDDCLAPRIPSASCIRHQPQDCGDSLSSFAILVAKRFHFLPFH